MKIQTEDFLFEQSEVSKEFSQKEVSDLVRDLGLSKQNSMLLASRLKSKNVLSVGTKVNFSFTFFLKNLKILTQYKIFLFIR